MHERVNGRAMIVEQREERGEGDSVGKLEAFSIATHTRGRGLHDGWADNGCGKKASIRPDPSNRPNR